MLLSVRGSGLGISRKVRLGGPIDLGVAGWSGPGWRRCATDTPGVVRTTRGGSPASAAAMCAAGHIMTAGITGQRRRTAVSMSVPVTSSDPVEQLDRALEVCHQVNQALPKAVLGREELIAIAGLLTQISAALLTFTDLLSAPTHHYDRTRLRRANTAGTPATRLPAATSLLRDCRDGLLTAYTCARAFHAELKQCVRNGVSHSYPELARRGRPGSVAPVAEGDVAQRVRRDE